MTKSKDNNKSQKTPPVYKMTIAGLFALFSLGAGIYKGVNSSSKDELLAWIVGGVLSGLFIILLFSAVDFGVIIWGESTNWLSEHIRKHPQLRFWIVFPSILFSLYSSYLVLVFLQTELFLRIFISLYLTFFLPAAIISLVREDLLKERTKLSQVISRETRIHNPQAAIENAFTHFENHLLKRVAGNSHLYGNRLIQFAYDGKKSKLVYKSDGKDYTPHLYKLMSGAYSIFRNPRHHKIFEDDEHLAQNLIFLSELLMKFIDDSEYRENEDKQVHTKFAT